MEQKVTWAQAVSNILTSPNSIIVLSALLILVLIVTILVKKGYVSLDLKGVKVGIADTERKIMRYQMDYCSLICTTFIDQQKLPEGCDPYRIKWVNELLFDEMVKWISYNHISTDKFYVETKQEQIWAIIVASTDKDFFHSPDLKKAVTDEVARIIERLVEIREFYSK